MVMGCDQYTVIISSDVVSVSTSSISLIWVSRDMHHNNAVVCNGIITESENHKDIQYEWATRTKQIWDMPNHTLRKPHREGHKLEVTLGYITRPHLKQNKQKQHWNDN